MRTDIIRFDVAGSFGDWKYLSDVTGTYTADEGSGETETYEFYLDGLYVGDAPQAQLAYAMSLFPAEDLYLQAVGKTLRKHYADDDDRGHDASAAEIFVGFPRTVNLGFQVIF